MKTTITILSAVLICGVLSAQETPRPAGIAAGKDDAPVPARFRLYDKNKDLKITPDELADRPNLFAANDSNQDGVISPAEFREFETRLLHSRRGRAQRSDLATAEPPLTTRAPDGATVYWPGSETWDTVTPAELGWNETALQEALDYIGSKHTGALIILHGGRIAVERYWNGWDETQRDTIASAAKSITSVLIGIAQDRGRLSVNDPITKHLGEGWSRAPSEKEARITIRHLLSMTSGLDEDLAFVADAGQKWQYKNTAYHVTWKVIEAATGQSLNAFTAEVLWKPLGMADSRWGEASHISNARDCARFGLMVLRQGEWRGQRIVSAEYLRESIKPSQTMNPAYGWLWWLNGSGKQVLPGGIRGPMIPPAPSDTFAALGRFDRKIYVVPSRDLVVVRMGEGAGVKRDALSSFDRELWQRLMKAISTETSQ